MLIRGGRGYACGVGRGVLGLLWRGVEGPWLLNYANKEGVKDRKGKELILKEATKRWYEG
jgi:hypothetical protein